MHERAGICCVCDERNDDLTDWEGAGVCAACLPSLDSMYLDLLEGNGVI